MILSLSLKDPDGIYDFLEEKFFGKPMFTDEDKEYLLRTYFRYGDYLDLYYDVETKELTVKKRY